jgi:CheY-like chemotaxis protein
MPVESAAAEVSGLLLSDDLIFTSRITGTAKDLGLSLLPARSAEILLAMAKARTPSCLILDLSNPTLQISELIERVREACLPMPRIVAYGSHVDTSTLRAARDAGCDLVLPRSKFVEDLPTALPDWMSPR